MTTALDNAIATANVVATRIEAGATVTALVSGSLPRLIEHLRSLDPTGERTADLIARLEAVL